MTDLSGGQQLFPVKTLLCLIVVVRRAHRGLQVIKDLCGDQGAGQQGVRGVLHEPVPGQAHAGQGPLSAYPQGPSEAADPVSPVE